VKIKLFVLFLTLNLFSQTIQVVPISNKVIGFKAKIYSSDVRLIRVNDKYFCKEYIDIKILKQNKYFAKHYIAKNKLLCKKDLFVPISRRIAFQFGNLEIEKDGEVIRETEKYIKIKNLNGKIEKIYKNGITR
jgi:hypothetical protein